MCANNGMGNLYGDYAMWFMLATFSRRRLYVDWTGRSSNHSRLCDVCPHVRERFDLSQHFHAVHGSWSWTPDIWPDTNVTLDATPEFDCDAFASLVRSERHARVVVILRTALFPHCAVGSWERLLQRVSRFQGAFANSWASALQPTDGAPGDASQTLAQSAIRYHMKPALHVRTRRHRPRREASPYVVLAVRTGWADEVKDVRVPRRSPSEAWDLVNTKQCPRVGTGAACPYDPPPGSRDARVRLGGAPHTIAHALECATRASWKFANRSNAIYVVSDSPGIKRAIASTWPTFDDDGDSGRRLDDHMYVTTPYLTGVALAVDIDRLLYADAVIAASVSTLVHWTSKPFVDMHLGNKVTPVCEFSCVDDTGAQSCPCDRSIERVTGMQNRACMDLRQSVLS